MSVKFKLNKSGFKTQVLQSGEMQQAIRTETERIRANCGEGYYSRSSVGRNRALGMVWAGTYEAMKDNSENNTLLRSIK